MKKFKARDVMELDPYDTGSWRWGSTHTYIVPADGKHYSVYLRFHCQEGYQDEDEVEGIEVEPYTVTETKWRQVKQPAAAPVAKAATT